MARWRARLGEADHRVPPGATLWVEVSGNVPELRAWLRPASHLDVRIVAGTPELRAAVSVGSGVLKLSSEIAGGIVPGDGPSVV